MSRNKFTPKDRKSIKATVENEGFDYAFVHYSDFPEIKDEEFQNLREAFLAARRALTEYCGLDDV